MEQSELTELDSAKRRAKDLRIAILAAIPATALTWLLADLLLFSELNIAVKMLLGGVVLVSLLVSGLSGLYIFLRVWAVFSPPSAGSQRVRKSERIKELRKSFERPRLTPESDFLDWQREGEFLLEEKQYAEALVALEKAFSLSPGECGTAICESEMLLGQTECLLALKRREDAERCLARVVWSLRYNDNAEIRRQAGALASRLGKSLADINVEEIDREIERGIAADD